jgi:hypothetical protein
MSAATKITDWSSTASASITLPCPGTREHEDHVQRRGRRHRVLPDPGYPYAGRGRRCVENGLDVCVYDPDNDDDGTADNIDAHTWNPRVVAPFGDGDLDGFPKGCDPDDTIPSPPGSPPDYDGDGRADTDDNCVDVSNADQTDSDADLIGDRCDNNPDVHDSGYQVTDTSGTPVCTGV